MMVTMEEADLKFQMLAFTPSKLRELIHPTSSSFIDAI